MSTLGEAQVSIIMPAYNCEDFIGATIESVITQTYENWELIIIDDCSTDHTSDKVQFYASRDHRIHYECLKHNSGAAVARNRAVEKARGKYVAFLDSDDLWVREKLSKQIAFMKEHQYTFTCTSYQKIDEEGKSLNQQISANYRRDYHGLLRTSAGNSTVMYDAEILGKCYVADIKKRNDYLMWLQVIQRTTYLYGLNEPLCSYRVRRKSLSSNKSSLLKYHWQVYRKHERLSVVYSCFLMFYFVFFTVFKLR